MSGDITHKRSAAEMDLRDDHSDQIELEDELEDELDAGLEDDLDEIDQLGADDFLPDDFDENQSEDQAELDDEHDAEHDAEPEDCDLDGELEADALADLLEDAGDAPEDDSLASIVDDAKMSSGGKRGLSVQARRAIEERAEQRRIERDLNYLDFDLDD